MELVACSYQELRAGTADVRQSRSIRGDGKTSRPGRTWSHCLGRIDRQHGPHYLLRRCGAQPTQIPPAEIRMASTVTAYNPLLSRRLRSLTFGVDAAMDGV